jgi:copper ion binding protein
MRTRRGTERNIAVNIATTQFKVTGMTCGHCSSAIQASVHPLAGVREVQVELGAKTVTVSYDGGQITSDQLRNAIEEDAGYAVNEMKEVGTS